MERNLRRTLSGIVVSDKMDKTRVVEIQTFKKHPLYGKRLKYNKKYKMHDELNKSQIGDVVKMRETKKISKDKYFILIDIKSSNSKIVKKTTTPKPIVKKEVKKTTTPKPTVKKEVKKTTPTKTTPKPVVKKITTPKPSAKK